MLNLFKRKAKNQLKPSTDHLEMIVNMKDQMEAVLSLMDKMAQVREQWQRLTDKKKPEPKITKKRAPVKRTKKAVVRQSRAAQPKGPQQHKKDKGSSSLNILDMLQNPVIQALLSSALTSDDRDSSS